MLFNSFGFLCVIPVVLFVYYLALHLFKNKGDRRVNRVGNTVLLVVSYAFFFYNQPVYTLLLFGLTLVTYIFGRVFEHMPPPSADESAAQASRQRKRRRKRLILAGAILVLLPLAVFKYYNFLLDLSAQAMAAFSLVWEPDHASWIIPLGISFFTFQALGYMWDVYYGRIPAEHNFADYMLFVAFFPQIASGPISKAADLMPQIKGRRSMLWTDISAGMKLLLWGYFLKAVFADRVAMFANPVFNNYEHFSGGSCFLASIMYSLQIYGDFAGYSLMAVGVARMLGFNLINNFNRPYFSASVGEFWRRWHISLSTWLKDYVYIPLGGSRKGKGRTYANLFATFLVSGIWHGANLTFIVWGALHGLFQSVEKFFSVSRRPHGRLMLILRVCITFLLVNFAWIFFRMSTLTGALEFIRRIFTAAPGVTFSPSRSDSLFMILAVMIVLIKELCEEVKPRWSLINNRNRGVRILTYLALIFAVLLMGVLDSSQFIYVNF